MPPFEKEHQILGGRPHLPILFTPHAIRRYAERFMPLERPQNATESAAVFKKAEAALVELSKRVTWHGKTRDGRPVLEADGVCFVVQRWECKYRVLTIIPEGFPIEASNAPIQPRNPRATHLRRALRGGAL